MQSTHWWMFLSPGWHICSMPTAAQPFIETLSGDMPDLLRPIKVQKRCASAGPILQVKSGSVTVPVYRCGDGRLPRFFIAYYRKMANACGRVFRQSTKRSGMLSWAKARSYLPKNEATEAEAVSKVKVGDTELASLLPLKSSACWQSQRRK